MSRPLRVFYMASPPLLLALTGCDGDNAVAMEEARAKVISAQAWGQPGPLGIPASGWAWMLSIGGILLFALIITLVVMLYNTLEDKRNNALVLEKKRIEARDSLARDLAKRKTCPACGTDPDTYVATAATLEEAAARAIEAKAKA